MTQDQAIILALKVVLLAGAASAALFVACYHYLTRGAVWGDEVGRTIVIKDILLVLMLLPTVMSLFFSFNRLTSYVAAWTDVGLFGLLTPVMLWRSIVFVKLSREGRSAADGDAGPGGTAAVPVSDGEGEH